MSYSYSRAIDTIIEMESERYKYETTLEAITSHLDKFGVPTAPINGDGPRWSTVQRVGYAAAMFAQWEKEHPRNEDQRND